MKVYKIGVFGSGEVFDEQVEQDAFQIGKAIASFGHVIVSGCCYGYPGAAVNGARSREGRCISFSPARNLQEHIEKYKLPPQKNEDVIYTNSNFIQRDVINVNACDGAIIVGGMTGTLHEFAISLENDLVVGILEDSGGIAELAFDIADTIKKPSSQYIIIQERDPILLVQQVISILDTRNQV